MKCKTLPQRSAVILNMFYKILPGSQLYEDLTALQMRLNDAFQKSHDFVFKKLAKKFNIKEYRSGKHTMIGSQFYRHTLAGGVTSFIIDGEKPKGWKNAGHGFFPRNIKANKELLEELHDLPVVEESECNNLIGYKFYFDDVTNRTSSRPGFKLSNDGQPHVFRFPEWLIPNHYTPPVEMIEITKTEYDTINEM